MSRTISLPWSPGVRRTEDKRTPNGWQPSSMAPLLQQAAGREFIASWFQSRRAAACAATHCRTHALQSLFTSGGEGGGRLPQLPSNPPSISKQNGPHNLAGKMPMQGFAAVDSMAHLFRLLQTIVTVVVCTNVRIAVVLVPPCEVCIVINNVGIH